MFVLTLSLSLFSCEKALMEYIIRAVEGSEHSFSIVRLEVPTKRPINEVPANTA